MAIVVGMDADSGPHSTDPSTETTLNTATSEDPAIQQEAGTEPLHDIIAWDQLTISLAVD